MHHVSFFGGYLFIQTIVTSILVAGSLLNAPVKMVQPDDTLPMMAFIVGLRSPFSDRQSLVGCTQGAHFGSRI